VQGTVAGYRAHLERFCPYAAAHGLDDAPVSDLDREMIRSYQRSVARGKTTAAGRATRRRLATSMTPGLLGLSFGSVCIPISYHSTS
jgi:hypothetical protein